MLTIIRARILSFVSRLSFLPASLNQAALRLQTWLQLGHAGAGRLLWAFIFLCVVIELTLLLLPGLRMPIYGLGAFWADLLKGGRPVYAAQPATMFVTYSVLHGGFEHLMGNMVMLYILGRQLRAVMGQGAMVLCFGAGVLGGAAGFALLNTSHLPMVGASGAVFGLAGALLAGEWWAFRRVGRVAWHVMRMMLLLLVLNVLLFVWFDGQLAWEAHLGGAIAGGLAGWAVMAWRP